MKVEPGQEIICRNPKEGDEIKAVFVNAFSWQWVFIPDSFCLLHFGKTAQDLKTEFEKRYPEAKDEPIIRFLMLKESK